MSRIIDFLALAVTACSSHWHWTEKACQVIAVLI